MIAVQTYGNTNPFRNLFKTRKGWLKMYVPFGTIDNHEEEQ